MPKRVIITTCCVMDSMKIATSIPDEVFWEAESLAKRMGVSKSELLRRALAAYLYAWDAKGHDADSAGDRVREILDEVYSQQDSSVAEALSKMQWASLPKENWPIEDW